MARFSSVASGSTSDSIRCVCVLLFLWVLSGALFVTPTHAQPGESTESWTRPAADPADVESPSAIVEAVYDVISAPAGERRDWERFRSLFVPDARLIPTDRQDGTPNLRVFTVEQFIGDLDWEEIRKEGFFERGIHAKTERFGDIAHVFSTYETRRAKEAPDPFQRGINSFQLWNDGDRWWIVTIFWHDEREGAEIPTRYLGGSQSLDE